MQRTREKIIGGFIGIVVFCLLWGMFTSFFQRKSDGMTMRRFYEMPENSIDILIMGSSLNAGAIHTYRLGAETGTSVYNLSVSAQTVAAREYYLKEVLKTQKPKLLVMEAYRYVSAPEMSVEEINYSASGMKASMNKWKFLWNVPIREGGGSRAELFVPLFAYHNRWAELTEKDWKKAEINYKYIRGETSDHMGIVPQNECVIPTSEIGKLTDEQKEYVDDIIRLTRENGIQLLFFNPPNTETNEGLYKIYNALYAYLDAQGIDWVDCNYEPQIRNQIDTTIDFVDDRHVNMAGGYKVSEYLAQYINSHYDLQGSFSENCEEYQNYRTAKEEELKQSDGVLCYLQCLYDDDWECYLKVADEYQDERMRKVLVGIPHKEWREELEKFYQNVGETKFQIVVREKQTGKLVDIVALTTETPEEILHITEYEK